MLSQFTIRVCPQAYACSRTISLPKRLPKYSAMPLTDTRVQTLTTGKRDERLVADTNGLYLRLRKGKGGITRTW
jgi:hypothetical protein